MHSTGEEEVKRVDRKGERMGVKGHLGTGALDSHDSGTIALTWRAWGVDL